MIDHEVRRTGLGGTDVAAILGLHPRRSALEVWAQKRGLVQPSQAGLAAEVGLVLEPWLADVYTRTTGIEVRPGPGTVRHPEHEWWVGTPDCLGSAHALVLEMKTVGLSAARRWGDPEHGPAGVPAEHSCQARWYAGLPLHDGAPAACTDVFPAFLGWLDSPPTPYRIWRDERIEARLLEIAEDWWRRYVVAGVEPPPDGSRSATEYIKRAYPDSIEPLGEASEAAEAWARELVNCRAARDEFDEHVVRLENQLRQEIGARKGIRGDGWKATWKANKNGVRSFRFSMRSE